MVDETWSSVPRLEAEAGGWSALLPPAAVVHRPHRQSAQSSGLLHDVTAATETSRRRAVQQSRLSCCRAARKDGELLGAWDCEDVSHHSLCQHTVQQQHCISSSKVTARQAKPANFQHSNSCCAYDKDHFTHSKYKSETTATPRENGASPLAIKLPSSAACHLLLLKGASMFSRCGIADDTKLISPFTVTVRMRASSPMRAAACSAVPLLCTSMILQ